MGNYLRCSHHHQSHSSCTTRPTTSGVTSSSCGRNTQSSATTSSSAAVWGPFSQTVSEIEEEDDLEEAGAKILEVPNLKVFTFSELRSATKNFRPDSLLGEGGFGKVYRGWLDSKTLLPSKPGFGMPVAIKKLSQGGMQGFEEWQSEVNFLGRVSHPNLVVLLGYCWEDKELLLVYEFMAKGSLEIHLFRRDRGIKPISWDLRLKIAIEVAQGLAFLHTSKMVIYRDFKSANILLDKMYNAKISDFGLVKLGPSGGASHVTTRVKGSYVYAAPEYVATGHLYVKSDVYGFGVVLLELMTGLMALDVRRPNGHQNLVDWLKPSLSKKKKIKTIMDVRIGSQYSSKGAIQLAELTLKCLQLDPKSRPSMREVLVALRRIRMLKVEKSKDEPKQGRTNNGGTCRQVPPLQYL